MKRKLQFLVNFFKKYSCIFSIFFTFFIIGLFYVTKLSGLKIYPVVVNFCIFLLFFTSLFAEETIIQKFARIAEGELSPIVLRYTRNLTYVWCVYLFFQFVASFCTLFLSDKIWIMFNGCISYILLGVFFAVEYFVRILFKRKHNL